MAGRRDCAFRSVEKVAILRDHTYPFASRGVEGHGPLKPRQPPQSHWLRGTVPIPSRCDWSAPLALRHDAKAKDGESKEKPMAVEALKCKECGEQYPLEARYVCDICFGTLE